MIVLRQVLVQAPLDVEIPKRRLHELWQDRPEAQPLHCAHCLDQFPFLPQEIRLPQVSVPGRRHDDFALATVDPNVEFLRSSAQHLRLAHHARQSIPDSAHAWWRLHFPDQRRAQFVPSVRCTQNQSHFAKRQSRGALSPSRSVSHQQQVESNRALSKLRCDLQEPRRVPSLRDHVAPWLDQSTLSLPLWRDPPRLR